MEQGRAKRSQVESGEAKGSWEVRSIARGRLAEPSRARRSQDEPRQENSRGPRLSLPTIESSGQFWLRLQFTQGSFGCTMWGSSGYEPCWSYDNAWGECTWKGRNPRGSLEQLQEILGGPKGLDKTVEHIGPFGVCWLLQASKMAILGGHITITAKISMMRYSSQEQELSILPLYPNHTRSVNITSWTSECSQQFPMVRIQVAP